MEDLTARVNRASDAAVRARKHWVAHHVGLTRDEYEAAVEAYLDAIKPLFDRGVDGRWGFEQLRRDGGIAAVRDLSGRLVDQIVAIQGRSMRTLRRQAYIAGATAMGVTIAHMGGEVPEPAQAAVSVPLSLVMQDRQIVIAEAARRVVKVNGVEVEIINPAHVVPAEDGLRHVARAIIVENDGGVWVFDPQDEPYVMFPGGGLEPGESYGEAAVREVLEETGLIIEVGEHIGDFVDDFAHRRYFLARRIGGSPTSMDEDGDRPVVVNLMSPEQAAQCLTSPYDRDALAVVSRKKP